MRETMMQVRAQAILTARLRERIDGEASKYLRALRMDDMPKTQSAGEGLDARMIRQEELARQLRTEEARLKRMERKARLKMSGMRPEMYAFCVGYYIQGKSIQVVGDEIDRGVRQCMRYKQKIEGKRSSV